MLDPLLSVPKVAVVDLTQGSVNSGLDALSKSVDPAKAPKSAQHREKMTSRSSASTPSAPSSAATNRTRRRSISGISSAKPSTLPDSQKARPRNFPFTRNRSADRQGHGAWAEIIEQLVNALRKSSEGGMLPIPPKP